MAYPDCLQFHFLHQNCNETALKLGHKNTEINQIHAKNMNIAHPLMSKIISTEISYNGPFGRRAFQFVFKTEIKLY